MRLMIPDLAIRYDFGTVWDFLFSPIILEALWVTLQISVLAMVLGIMLGVVLAVMRVSKNPIISTPAGIYVWFWLKGLLQGHRRQVPIVQDASVRSVVDDRL